MQLLALQTVIQVKGVIQQLKGSKTRFSKVVCTVRHFAALRRFVLPTSPSIVVKKTPSLNFYRKILFLTRENKAFLPFEHEVQWWDMSGGKNTAEVTSAPKL